MSGWGHDLAMIWTNTVPPSRPSIEEMCVYTRHLRELQKELTRPAKVLVLGSTPEFRDWCFNENLVLHVVDKSEEYYNTVTREIRHKNLKEELHISLWEDMFFSEQFDIIIGDLAIGNIDPCRFDDFLRNVKNALAPNGLFIGKSLIWNKNEAVKEPKEIVDEYRSQRYIHPYTFINHQLGLYCLDKESYLIDFGKMYNELASLKADGFIEDDLFSYFADVGWNTEMKFKFFAPSQDFFVRKVNEYLSFKAYEYTSDVYSYVFPIYVAKKE